MNRTEKNRLRVLRQTRDFLKSMREEPTISVAFTELEAVIERMTAEGTRQDRQTRQAKIGTDQVAVLARTLRTDLLRPVLNLVKIVVPDPSTSGFPVSASLTLPQAKDRQGLITAATGVYETAKPFEARLTAAGLPKDHLAALLAGIAALRSAIDARAQNMLERGAAVATTQEVGKRAVRLLRLIDSLVVPLIRGDAGMMRAWGAAKRMGYSASGAVAATAEPGTDAGGATVTPLAPAGGSPAVAVLSGNEVTAEGVVGEVAKAA